MNERLFDEGPDPQCGRQRGSVGQCHLLRRVEGVEAVLRPAPPAGPALAAHRTPVQHDEVANVDVADIIANRLNDARNFVAE